MIRGNREFLGQACAAGSTIGARVMVGAAVAPVAGVAISLAATAVPARAAQHPGSVAASRTRPATGLHTPTGRVNGNYTGQDRPRQVTGCRQ